MQGLWLFLPALAGFVSAVQGQRDFMLLCSEISLDPSLGRLDAFCESAVSEKPDHLSQVDLNGCLGWGPAAPANHLQSKQSSEYELFPAIGGNFTEYCDNCHIIQEGQSDTQVGHILCSCGPKGSDVKLEYIYDLKNIVRVNNNGCLKCLLAPSVCGQIKRRESPASVEGEPISPSAVSKLIDGQHVSFGPRNGTDINDCDGLVAETLMDYPNAIPKTYRAKPIRPCDSNKGPGLCCFFPLSGRGYLEQGFHLIETHDYIYRIQYEPGYDGAFTELTLALRFCKYPENPNRCPEGDPVEDTGPSESDPRFPKPTNTSTTSVALKTDPPHVSTRPIFVGALDSRGIPSLKTSRFVTGIPDTYFPTPTLTSETPSSQVLTSGSSEPTNPELKIDLGQLDTPGLVDIMLGATNIEEVRRAHLNLRLTTTCSSDKAGKAICKEVVVEFTGHAISNGTGVITLLNLGTRSMIVQKIKEKTTKPSKTKSFDSTVTKTETRTIYKPTTSTSTKSTITTRTTVSTHKTKNTTALATGLSKRSDTPLSQLDDTAQAVLGPRAATATQELQGPVFSTLGYSSKTTSESKSEKPKKSRTTKTKTKKVTKTELMPTTKTVTDTKNTVTMTETQTVPGNATGTMLLSLLQRSQSLQTETKDPIGTIVTSASPTRGEMLGPVFTTVGGSVPEPSVIITYITEEVPLSDDAGRSSSTEMPSVYCGLMGCP